MKKCCVCKMPVPQGTRVCPACGQEYTGFQYFRMNIMSRLIWLIVLAVVAYNLTVIIIFNREVREFMDPESDTTITYETLKEHYEELNVVQQYLSRYSDLDNGVIKNVTNTEVHVDGDVDVTVFTQSGSYDGKYRGELTDAGSPHGAGKVVFTNNDGVQCTYEGEFNDGVLSGYGTLTFETGEILKGSFIEGMLNGYGEKYGKDKNLLAQGAFINNKLNGNGILYAADGNTIFNGRFEYGLPIKAHYTPVCGTVDYSTLKSSPRSFIGKNIAISGVLSDVHVDENKRQFYLFTPENDPAASFMVYCENTETDFRLTNKYTVYGYCSDYTTITNSHSVSNHGLKITGYHFDEIE